MKFKNILLPALLFFAVQVRAQDNFPNGIVVSKGSTFSGSGVFAGSVYASHFHYSDTEDTYIRGGKPSSSVLIGDVGTSVILGNAGANTYSVGQFIAQNGLAANKGTNFSGSALFSGTEWTTHFHYSNTEDTYIRGGKSTSNIYISDVNNNVIMGSVSSLPAGYRLYVDKGILTEKVKVALKTSGDWADHVFKKDYPLMPLSQVEQFIKTNQHLPGIFSAEQMVKEGNDLAKTDAKLLEKIEELTLYIIELNKKINRLDEENKEMRKTISANTNQRR